MMTETEERQTRRTGQAVTGVVATTGLIVWALDELMSGPVPGPVHVFVQWAVPAASGALTTWWARRQGGRRSLPDTSE